ncbi:MAG: ATP-binding protein [Syntrophobacterales bacterium]|nr:ATP-binding protein [Syntrophobacterales bacterium]
MLNQQTINKLYELKLTGMADAFADQIKQPDMDRLSFAERFGLIVDRQWTWKENNRMEGYRAFYIRSPKFSYQMALAKGDGSYGKTINKLAKAHVLVIDDLGLAPMNDAERRDLPEVVEERHGHASTIVTSQLPVENWHEQIGDSTIADAILDRLIHNAHKINLSVKGGSLRKKYAGLT